MVKRRTQPLDVGAPRGGGGQSPGGSVVARVEAGTGLDWRSLDREHAGAAGAKLCEASRERQGRGELTAKMAPWITPRSDDQFRSDV